ncbi:hypothetical protein EDD37DRAFT_37303 [Exophiala viscosa]|uniref:Secreted protein n=1 Tax=Exophiala viscosa TaxID=2486360 RepID=A0AAN6E383_9EURO|nr:hypothetical protein EDD36DRAFT_161004 [Exophiala viscosa]KAI1629116.1 hypothetical protein EDD37DRAFT_37303 [Exophiala viscosa]
MLSSVGLFAIFGVFFLSAPRRLITQAHPSTTYLSTRACASMAVNSPGLGGPGPVTAYNISLQRPPFNGRCRSQMPDSEADLLSRQSGIKTQLPCLSVPSELLPWRAGDVFSCSWPCVLSCFPPIPSLWARKLSDQPPKPDPWAVVRVRYLQHTKHGGTRVVHPAFLAALRNTLE